MDQQTYEQHKQTLASGKIAISKGRTAATVEELDAMRQAEGGSPFGGQQPKPGEVMAISSGRLSPALVSELGTEHPLVVAAQRLTAEQLDGLADYFAAPPASSEDDAPSAPAAEAKLSLTDDKREQAAQVQAATGALDNLTPKAVSDNKTDAPVLEGKDASKTKADTVQAEAKQGAASAS